uniref:Uncharacterized protein n=1 Tax=Arundo donax TaxID=35708 RepID=A0A0A9DD91_ARUDO
MFSLLDAHCSLTFTRATSAFFLLYASRRFLSNSSFSSMEICAYRSLAIRLLCSLGSILYGPFVLVVSNRSLNGLRPPASFKDAIYEKDHQ